jgi:HlyD family secretion protein
MTKHIQSPKSAGLLLLVLAGCSPAAVAQPKAAASGEALEVVMAGKPGRKSLTLTTTQPARIEALEQTPIHSKLAAYVAEVLADYGDHVKQQQPLLRLWAPEIETEVVQKGAMREQSRAELTQAQADSRSAEAAVMTARSRVAQAEAGTARAQADIDRWRSEFARIDQLATSGSINRQLVDETQQKYRAAEALMKESVAAIDAARAVLSESQAQAAKAVADIEAAQARVRVAEANIAQAEAMRSYLTITAPFDGVVTQRHVDPGHFVQPAGAGPAPLLVVARADKIRVFAAVPEMEAGLIDIGDPVTIEIQSLRGAEIKGQVTRTGFALDVSSRSLETIIDLDNRDGRIRPGLYATAKIILAEKPDALVLPSAAAVRQGKEAFCYRLIDRKAVKTPIVLGIKVGDDMEVTSGLSDNDTVILNKALSLKDGQPVDVLKTEAKK